VNKPNSIKHMNKPLFFKNKENNYNLFGFLFQPEIKNINNQKGVIFCDSIGSEKYYSHRVLVNFARLLQARGYCAFLFDYYGNGDSEGDFENTRLDTYLSDVRAAIEFLMEETKIEEICLLGVRLGSVFASLVAAEEKRVERLALWSPIIDVGKYLYDSLRANLNMQFSLYKTIKFNRDQLIEQIKNNVLVEGEGHVISRDFYHSFSQISLKKIKMRPDVRALLVDISKNTGAMSKELSMLFEDNNQCIRMTVNEGPFWVLKGTNQIYTNQLKALFEKTLCWLEDSSNDQGKASDNGHRKASEL